MTTTTNGHDRDYRRFCVGEIAGALPKPEDAVEDASEAAEYTWADDADSNTPGHGRALDQPRPATSREMKSNGKGLQSPEHLAADDQSVARLRQLDTEQLLDELERVNSALDQLWCEPFLEVEACRYVAYHTTMFENDPDVLSLARVVANAQARLDDVSRQYS